MSKKLTVKQAKFVKGIAEGKTQTESYIEAYDTKGHLPTVEAEASRTASLPQVKNALEQLFGFEETKQIVANVHKLAISANDEKVQLDASKEWLSHVAPKNKDNNGTTYNFTQINAEMSDKYND